MKDFILLLLAYIPTYVPELAHVVAAPRRFLAEQPLGGDVIKRSFMFLGVSIVLAEFASFSSRYDIGVNFLDDIVKNALVAGVAVFLAAAMSAAVWHIVGGRLPFERCMQVSNYAVGVVSLVMTLITVTAIGFLKFLIPNFTALWTGPRTPTPSDLAPYVTTSANQHPLLYVAFGLYFFVVVVSLPVWVIVATFGTYRVLDPIPLPRAISAAMLCVLGAAAVLPLLALFAYAG